jgi:4-amino-4-deoxy-L-arabinose transferase-like glycosyltransferase
MPVPMVAIGTWARRWGMEILLATLAGVVFLSFLGSVDLWGKREQRASAEALDTVDQNHWLVAQIQGRPRLEKPPLPRWTIATLVTLTGRRDEAIVRLPSAFAALGMVALVYALGCRLGGRSVGLASGFVLTSLAFFVSELRQAGNDGPLAFFATLALYAAWRRLHGDHAEIGEGPAGARGWSLLMYAALGLGFLTKGPIVLVLVLLALIPYLTAAGRLREGLRRLADAWGLVLFAVLALSWPVPVLWNDLNAARVWYLEMGQKAGTAGVSHHRRHEVLAVEWPWMTAPWCILAAAAVILPFLPRGREYRPRIWFPWSWAIGNLAMFCLWPVAKPNYYLPCLPGVALLAGIEWVRLSRVARGAGAAAGLARRVLQFHWVTIFVAAAILPVVIHQAAPRSLLWVVIISATAAAGAVVSAWAWRRGADAGALAPLVAAIAVAIMVVYGALAPPLNETRSHRALAAALERILPADARTVMFFRELDEGLWFYLRDRTLVPVPGSQPEYNKGFDLFKESQDGLLELDPGKRLDAAKRILLRWVARADRPSSYVLIRKRFYDPFAPSLEGLVTPLHAEQGLARNELVLLRVDARRRFASRTTVATKARD